MKAVVRTLVAVSLVAAALWLLSWGGLLPGGGLPGQSPPTPAATPPETPAREAPPKPTVDPGELKALLPLTLNGFQRGALGETPRVDLPRFKHVGAQARYSGPQGASLSVEISDTGGGASAWQQGADLKKPISIQDETGRYTKTTLFGDYPALESYDPTKRTGELKVMVGERFFLKVEGIKVGVDVLRSAVGELQPERLEALRE